jgi:hypothetical protein
VLRHIYIFSCTEILRPERQKVTEDWRNFIICVLTLHQISLALMKRRAMSSAHTKFKKVINSVANIHNVASAFRTFSASG